MPLPQAPSFVLLLQDNLGRFFILEVDIIQNSCHDDDTLYYLLNVRVYALQVHDVVQAADDEGTD